MSFLCVIAMDLLNRQRYIYPNQIAIAYIITVWKKTRGIHIT